MVLREFLSREEFHRVEPPADRPALSIVSVTADFLSAWCRMLDLLANHYHEGVSLLMSLAIGAKAPAELRAALHRATAQNPAGVVLGDLQACDAFDVMSRISTVQAPTLVICGEEDQLTPPKYSRFLGQRIAGACVSIVPGAGHYVQVEKPRETTAAIREFLVRLGE